MRKIISLNDDQWQFGSVEQTPFGDVNDLDAVRAWLPARVPGDVRLDLMRAGKISDPFYAGNNESSQWIDARDWWYTRELALALQTGERAFLIFDGIDYQSAVFVNGAQLGRHAGMFSQQIYEIPSTVNSQQSTGARAIRNSQLAVRIWGSDALPKLNLSRAQKLWAKIIAPLYRAPEHPYPDRYATLKCQMQFGWDFAPRLRTCGIWDDARVVIARSVFIRDAWIKSQIPNVKSQNAHVQILLELDSDRKQIVRVVVTARGKNFESAAQTFEFDLQLARGIQSREIIFDLQNAQLWNPWDRGDPNLYEIEISLHALASLNSLDSLNLSCGIRAFELVRDNFIVNGHREFGRGANWVPLDAIPARLTRDDYAARLKQARDANINFLRVWGGGLREKRAFYDRCDELGILVWQEFPFAGAILDRFPRDRAFLDFTRAECGAIVRALRNHPSLVVWCGGNEFNTRGNRAIVETLREVVQRADGTRPFKPASPSGDESHNWRVWHRFANLRDYKRDQTLFLSEFGLQAIPNLESLEKFLPRDASPALWEYHHAELKKLDRYARPVIASEAKQSPTSNAEIASPKPLAMTIDATQRAQAHGLQIAIEHVRRRKVKTRGVAIWQLNDPWPTISWSVIDYFGAPKIAYSELQKLYAPVFASFDYALTPRRAGDTITGDLWIINDLRASFHNAQLTAYLNDQEIFARRVNIAPDSAERVDTLAVKLVAGENILRLKINWGPPTLSDHSYDLNFCDVGEISLKDWLMVTLGRRLTR
jgi:beta-mannosidase